MLRNPNSITSGKICEISLSLHSPGCQFVSLSIYLPVCMSVAASLLVHPLSACLLVYLSPSLFVCIHDCQSVYSPTCQAVHLVIRLPVCLSVRFFSQFLSVQTVCLFLSVSVCLSLNPANYLFLCLSLSLYIYLHV